MNELLDAFRVALKMEDRARAELKRHDTLPYFMAYQDYRDERIRIEEMLWEANQ